MGRSAGTITSPCTTLSRLFLIVVVLLIALLLLLIIIVLLFFFFSLLSLLFSLSSLTLPSLLFTAMEDMDGGRGGLAAHAAVGAWARVHLGRKYERADRINGQSPHASMGAKDWHVPLGRRDVRRGGGAWRSRHAAVGAGKRMSVGCGHMRADCVDGRPCNAAVGTGEWVPVG